MIVVGTKAQPAVQALLADAKLKTAVDGLAAEQYVLKTLQHEGRPVLLVAGGDATGTLYAAYRFAEHLGVRFYLHGDVIPDKQIALELPTLDETRKPLFDRRGIQPFHDFPEGPDWWSRDGYKAILGQLPKMGMNFFGLHTYPEGDVGPEPLVWIGPPREIAPDGKVKASYPSRHFTTSNVTEAWGYRPGKTSDYVFGAAEMFDRDDYGADYMRDTYPWNKMSPEQCNALFDRMGEFLSRRVHVRPSHGHQDVHRHGDAADRAHAAESAVAGGGQEGGRPSRSAGALRGHIPANRQDSSLGLLLALDARGLAVAGEAEGGRRHGGGFSAGDCRGRRRSSRRSRWPRAVGCSARCKTRRCSISSCPRRCR